MGSLCHRWIQGLPNGIEASMPTLWRRYALEGQGLVEYGLIMLLVAVALAATLSALGTDVIGHLQYSTDRLFGA
jgi:Flp pilus assembly pilin Flp